MENEGRKEFTLPMEDIEYLEKNEFNWETIVNNGNWLIIYDYPIPDGYNVKLAQVALMIPPNYPAAQIDMVYFFPHLQKVCGKAINAITNQLIDKRDFQRWSRHRQANEWRPGEDCVMTHLLLVNNWLEKDLKR